MTREHEDQSNSGGTTYLDIILNDRLIWKAHMIGHGDSDVGDFMMVTILRCECQKHNLCWRLFS